MKSHAPHYKKLKNTIKNTKTGLFIYDEIPIPVKLVMIGAIVSFTLNNKINLW